MGSLSSSVRAMEYGAFMEDMVRFFEVIGVAVIVVGGGYGLIRPLFDGRFSHHVYYAAARTGFGRPLLLGLEILVAADVIQTVTVEKTLKSVVALGVLVLVRVILSFSLDVEIDGILPWRRKRFALAEDEVGTSTK